MERRLNSVTSVSRHCCASSRKSDRSSLAQRRKPTKLPEPPIDLEAPPPSERARNSASAGASFEEMVAALAEQTPKPPNGPETKGQANNQRELLRIWKRAQRPAGEFLRCRHTTP